ncbi:MAG: ferritin-like domain-containing protein, partial [Alphaproteobacteria bacterium]|nr:ferritin-like domain-containing protein [Alphaproteobacteria bacterium]
MSEQITRDPAYNTVDRDDFRSMIEVDRYAERSTAFDGIIAATHDHFWDPLDKAYIDFDQPFDVASEMILPAEQIIELNSAVADKLDEGQRI